MSFLNNLRVYSKILFPRISGCTPAERLESFYSGQAEFFDDFRKGMLHGREELMRAIPVPKDGIWVDMGGGTGNNLHYLGDKLKDLRRIYLVDLCASLLSVARQRVEKMKWRNVEIIKADITSYKPPEEYADVVTFSYSLSMVSNWLAALNNAEIILQPGGFVGVVDYYISQKHPAADNERHSWVSRQFWAYFFKHCDVHLSPDQLPYLCSNYEKQHLFEGRARIPYFPWLKPPYFRFIGRKL
ncbi:MAG: hypothetical protein A2X46_06540 [Lentisphaerae bacterium GWF2_57_35]|nr:MAG: hypothetical protein A2X46_06540 [Lentisphaerae bacterium GWF2_57_35]